MKTKYKAGFLYRLYRKRTSSFLLNLYTAGITGLEDDIHKTRTDIKKIRAFYSFLDVIYQGRFRKEKHYRSLRRLFLQAGKLREVQIDLMILEQYGTHTAEEQDFRKFLQRKEKVLSRKFLEAMRDYDEQEIVSGEKEVEKFMNDLESKSFTRNVDKFISRKFAHILGYLPEIHNPEILHRIRKQLKTVSSILDVSLRCSRKPNIAANEMLSGIHDLEELIGIWHDNMVFLDALKVYRKAKVKTLADPDAVLASIESKVSGENEELVTRLEVMIRSLIPLPEKRKSRDA
jgi:CHAD domain-containing protein